MAPKINLLVVTTALVVVIFHGGDCAKRLELINSGQYTFQSAADFGFLTNPGGSDEIGSNLMSDPLDQIWVVRKSNLHTSYLFTTLRKYQDKVAMSVGTRKSILIALMEKYESETTDVLYWSIIPSEQQNYHLIKIFNKNLCLESIGQKQHVTISQCDSSSKNQQWNVQHID